MPEATVPPPKSGKLRTAMRLLAWFLPGLSAPGLVLLAFLLSYGGTTGDWIILALFVVLVVFTIGCAVLDAFFSVPPPDETERSRPKRIARDIVVFLLLQILLVPALGITTAAGCNAVISSL